MKWYLLCLSLLAAVYLFPGTVAADDLDEFKELLGSIRGNIELAKKANTGSSISKDFEEKLSKMEDLALKIQTVVSRLHLGDDFNFVGYTRQLHSAYRNANHVGFQSNKNSMEKRPGFWFPVTQLERNVSDLKKMGFTTDNGGSYEKELKKVRGLMEYERLLNYFVPHVLNVDSLGGSNTYWRDSFNKKVARMKFLANRINMKLVKTNPDLHKKYNFASETNRMVDNYNRLLALKNKTFKDKKKDFSSSSSESDSLNFAGKAFSDAGGQNEEQCTTELNYSLMKIREGLAELYAISFALEDNTDEEVKKEADTNDEAVDNETPLEEMTAKQLRAKLLDIRNEIYKKNNSMTGINKKVMEIYLKTLTKTAKTRYESICRRYSERGSKGDNSRSAALLEMHGLFRGKQLNEPKEEMLKVLQGYEKNKEKFDAALDKERYRAQWK